MLFDLRSPGRRRAIKVIYAGLAVLMGGGLVFFGIGGDAPGGLGDALGLTDQGGGAASSFEDQIKDAEQKVEDNPRNQAAVLELIAANYAAATSTFERDESTGAAVPTGDSEPYLSGAADAWDRYLALKPKRPDTGSANQISQVYFALAQIATSATEVQTDLDAAADAQRLVAEAEPSLGAYAALAQYLYLAGEFKAGDAAARRAQEEAPGAQGKAAEERLKVFESEGKRIAKLAKSESKQPGATGSNPLEEPLGPLGGSALGP